jgi:hypothetical protein
MVSIVAFQAVDPSSILDRRILCFLRSIVSFRLGAEQKVLTTGLEAATNSLLDSRSTDRAKLNGVLTRQARRLQSVGNAPHRHTRAFLFRCMSLLSLCLLTPPSTPVLLLALSTSFEACQMLHDSIPSNHLSRFSGVRFLPERVDWLSNETIRITWTANTPIFPLSFASLSFSVLPSAF